jgi:hypothetical protein
MKPVKRMGMGMLSVLVVAGGLALGGAAGCDSQEVQAPPPPVPVGFTPDESVNAGGGGAEVYLKGRVAGDRVVVDVIAKGAADVHGAAFRLHWDSAKLAFVEARGSDAWSQKAVLVAKEGIPGELVVAWTEKGTGKPLDARDDTILGSIDFTVKTHDGASLAFRTDRSMLIDTKGTNLVTSWRAGKVAAR